MAGTFTVKKCVHDSALTNRLHAHIWLLQTYAIPASMYASQIWSTSFLKQGKEMDNQPNSEVAVESVKK